PRRRRPRPRGAERGVRLAEPRRDARARPRRGTSQRERRRHRARASARDERRPARRLAPARAAQARRPLRGCDPLRRRRPGPGGALRGDGVTKTPIPARSASYSQSLERGLAILSAFKSGRPLLGVSDLAAEVGLSRSTTHRYIATL